MDELQLFQMCSLDWWTDKGPSLKPPFNSPKLTQLSKSYSWVNAHGPTHQVTCLLDLQVKLSFRSFKLWYGPRQLRPQNWGDVHVISVWLLTVLYSEFRNDPFSPPVWCWWQLSALLKLCGCPSYIGAHPNFTSNRVPYPVGLIMYTSNRVPYPVGLIIYRRHNYTFRIWFSKGAYHSSKCNLGHFQTIKRHISECDQTKVRPNSWIRSSSRSPPCWLDHFF